MALTRAGIRHFWAASERDRPQLHVLEGLPIALLLAACVVLTVQAEGVMRFTTATARALYAPAGYVRAVLNAPPGPAPATVPGPPERRPGHDEENPARTAGLVRAVCGLAAAQPLAQPGHLLLALLLALGLPVLFKELRPRVRVRHLGTVLRLCWTVVVDTTQSNIAVRFLLLPRTRATAPTS
jgi:hypothetical protein